MGSLVGEVAWQERCARAPGTAWGATRTLAENRDKWHWTVKAVFQPGEETAQGAHAMIDDGMVKRFPKPDDCRRRASTRS